MKALSLHQPFATLVAIGEKTIETRSWGSSYRGPLLIHATKALPLSWGFMRNEHFVDVLEPLVGLNECGVPNIDQLPRGALLGSVELLDVVAMTEPVLPDSRGRMIYQPPEYAVSDRDLAFGDYTAGRYAWMMGDALEFQTPFPARGRQRLWNFSLTDALIDLMADAIVHPSPAAAGAWLG